MSQHGVCRECYQDFITRWHDAYITEIEEFCDCVATGRKATPGVIDGTQSTKIAFRCKESFLTDKKLTLESSFSKPHSYSIFNLFSLVYIQVSKQNTNTA